MINIKSQVFGRVICSIPSAGKRSVYLTFDDGPDEIITPAILDLLGVKNIKATFFLVGKKALKHGEITREIILNGHAIGNHTYSHNNFLTLSSRSRIFKEITEANKVFREHFDYDCRIFRPCAGLKDFYIMNIVQNLGMNVIGWNKRSLDTIFKDYRKVYKRIANNGINDGDIILFHDSDTRLSLKDKLKAIEMVIDLYLQKGFDFCLISRNLNP